jgi:PIN domain nuclease of toxin-antitoxin system
VAVVTLYAMDGCALLAFLRGEPGDTIVAGLLADQDDICRIHAINLCEVYYDTLRVAAKLVD